SRRSSITWPRLKRRDDFRCTVNDPHNSSFLRRWFGKARSLSGKPVVKRVDEQVAVIRRGIAEIVPEPELRQKLERSLKSGTPLRVKFGIDPTSVDVHLGHTVPLRKLRQFQELGHQAVLIIGNYTALVGDPSGRDQTRARLSQEQVETNARDYLRQVSRIID